MSRFPGVYPQVIDQSFTAALNGQFSAGLIGPANRGPLNTPVTINTLSDYAATFGGSIPGTYLPLAVNAVAPWGGTMSVSRIGHEYAAAIGSASGSANSYNLFGSQATLVSAGQYVQVSQIGKATTFNAQVQSVSTGTVVLVSSGAGAVALADTYTAAAVEASSVSQSIASAETLLDAPVYGSQLTAAGTVIGTKSAYSFTVSGNASALAVGSTIKIVQTGSATTREAVVATVVGNTVTLITITNTATGQQAVALQDNYTAGQIFVQTGAYVSGVFMQGATPGTWANSDGAATSGLVVQVSPGAAQDTKTLLVFLNGVLVATYNSLIWGNPSSPNYWVTALAGSPYVIVRDGILLSAEPPANTLAPWNVPANPTVNVAAMAGGADGATLTDADYVGGIDLNGDASGLQVFNDPRTYGAIYLFAAPGYSSPAVQQTLAQISGTDNARSVNDVPDMVNAAQAIDYCNGQGAYSANAVLNNFRGSLYWNWFQTTDPFTGATVWAPPTVGVLAAIAKTFNQNSPWYAAAGLKRGVITIAQAVRYPRVQQGTLSGMQGQGSTAQLNPILLDPTKAIVVWGEVSSQRVQSFLQSNAVVDLVNYFVKNLSAIARLYVFDPNDPTLASTIDLQFTQVIQGVIAQRGISGNYNLQILQTSAMINNFSLTVNFSMIPNPPVYEIDLNVIVNQSGAQLNTINGGPVTSQVSS